MSPSPLTSSAAQPSPTPRRSARLATRSPPDQAPAGAASAGNPASNEPRSGGKRPAKNPPTAAAASASGDRSKRARRQKEEETRSCCICMSPIGRRELATIDCCSHQFCFECIATWSKTQNKCPLCKVRFQKISRVHPVRTCRNTSGDADNNNNRNELDCEDRNELQPARRITLNLAAAFSSSGSGNNNDPAYTVASQIFQEIAPMITGTNQTPESIARMLSARLRDSLLSFRRTRNGDETADT